MSSGTIDINIKTGTPLTETVTVIDYATYSSDIIIEDGRVLLTTFLKNLGLWNREITTF